MGYGLDEEYPGRSHHLRLGYGVVSWGPGVCPDERQSKLPQQGSDEGLRPPRCPLKALLASRMLTGHLEAKESAETNHVRGPESGRRRAQQ